MQAESFECVSEREEVVVSIGTVGIDEGELESVKVFPNPTANFVNVAIPEVVDGAVQLEIFDVAVNLIQSREIVAGTSAVELTEVAKGVYLLKLTSNNGFKTSRLVVQ